MRPVFKVVRWLLTLIVILVILVGAGGYIYLRQSLPQVEGVVKVNGLNAPVEIIRDADAVPHIYAQNMPDGYFGLGYVHAQDRLWQMELQRRVGRGRLSEIFGPAAVGGDRFLRTLGVYRAARDAWESFPAESKQIVEAYMAGL